MPDAYQPQMGLLCNAALELDKTGDQRDHLLATVMREAVTHRGSCCTLDCAEHKALAGLAAIILRAGHPDRRIDPDLDAAMQSVWLHGNWRYLTEQMTTDEREAAALAVERAWAATDDGEDLPSVNLRWWADPYEEIDAAVEQLQAALDGQNEAGGLLPTVAVARLRLASAMAARPGREA